MAWSLGKEGHSLFRATGRMKESSESKTTLAEGNSTTRIRNPPSLPRIDRNRPDGETHSPLQPNCWYNTRLLARCGQSSSRNRKKAPSSVFVQVTVRELCGRCT